MARPTHFMILALLCCTFPAAFAASLREMKPRKAAKAAPSLLPKPGACLVNVTIKVAPAELQPVGQRHRVCLV